MLLPREGLERLKRRRPMLLHGSGAAGVGRGEESRGQAATGLPSVLQSAGHRAGGLRPDGKRLGKEDGSRAGREGKGQRRDGS